ncbi:hypothetical protein [Streptomyces sp. HGB0020]|uniref:hypothetical protein n=1 Tax=Streptomyces sp. HGB0020 TaxID=1078086 RepID=UPI00034E1CF8|nr:hypothetical protein [Streptomyces sp. HGB0020]EPD63156.1 hypothetical protein HMPREF1211_03497 [Streptomyces sp. HGB0020]
MKVRADVAELLRAGATYAEIKRQLGVGGAVIKQTRAALDIPVPPGRAKRTRAELDAIEREVLAMLRAGASYAEIYKRFRFNRNRVAELRRLHKIPLPDRDHHASRRRSIDDAFTLYALPSTTGDHLIWTGPRSRRGVDLIADGRKHNARAVAFTKHHGREPEGRLRRTCDVPDCIAGAHHTDRRIRQAHARADDVFDAIFGGGT